MIQRAETLWREALLGPMPLAFPLIAVCLLCFALSAALSLILIALVGDGSASGLFGALWTPLPTVLIQMGAGGFLAIANWQPWYLFTAIFLHASLPHLIVDMICLMMIMPAIEKVFGRLRAFIIFMLAGLAGSLASAFYGELYTLGTSSATFGLFGAALVFGSLRGNEEGRRLMFGTAKWAALNFVFGLFSLVSLAPSVSFAGLFGGFIAGVMTALAMIYRIGPSWLPGLRRTGLGLASIALLSLALGVGTAVSSAWQAWSAPDAYAKDANDDQIARLGAVIALDDGNAAAHALRGAAYALKDDYASAIPDLDAALAGGVDSPQLRNLRAWSLYKVGRAADGLPDANAALAVTPDDAATLDTRAHIYEDLGRRDEAIADYRAALVQNPDIAESKAGLQRLTGGQ
ncbi:rhomboid family intramembrane serine protease [Labrys okinawensis]|uniref:rhomboid family intramembrane serine protease n=1 Tax=Labrys okinawensis TaxID=346911 RepID=UPI0039BC2EA2